MDDPYKRIFGISGDKDTDLSGVRSNDLLSVPIRTEKLDPDRYRLAKKLSGEIILQGAFFWQEGNNYGHKWKDLPIIELDR